MPTFPETLPESEQLFFVSVFPSSYQSYAIAPETPAVSLQVKALEEELGARLFDRMGPRKLLLTDEGKVLLEMLSPLIEGMEALPARFAEACGREQKGVVRVATHASVMTHLLPEAIRAFRKGYPECGLSIVNRGREEIIAMLNDGEADIGITSLARVPKGLDYRVFAKFRRMLIAAKGHALSKKRSSVGLKDIAAYPLIVPPKGSNTRAVIDRVFNEKGVEYAVAMELIGRNAVKTYVSMDLGISIINEYHFTLEDRKGLFVKDVSSLFGTAERGVVSRKGRHLSAAARGLVEMVCSHCRS